MVLKKTHNCLKKPSLVLKKPHTCLKKTPYLPKPYVSLRFSEFHMRILATDPGRRTKAACPMAAAGRFAATAWPPWETPTTISGRGAGSLHQARLQSQEKKKNKNTHKEKQINDNYNRNTYKKGTNTNTREHKRTQNTKPSIKDIENKT